MCRMGDMSTKLKPLKQKKRGRKKNAYKMRPILKADEYWEGAQYRWRANHAKAECVIYKKPQKGKGACGKGMFDGEIEIEFPASPPLPSDLLAFHEPLDVVDLVKALPEFDDLLSEYRAYPAMPPISTIKEHLVGLFPKLPPDWREEWIDAVARAIFKHIREGADLKTFPLQPSRFVQRRPYKAMLRDWFLISRIKLRREKMRRGRDRILDFPKQNVLHGLRGDKEWQKFSQCYKLPELPKGKHLAQLEKRYRAWVGTIGPIKT